MNIVKITMAAALVTFVAAGCCPCKKYQKKYGKPLQETEWKMVQFNGRTFDAQDGYTVVFGKDNRLSGVGDCNRLMGSYTADNDGVMKISQVASTRMMCPDQGQQNSFMQMLGSVDSYQMDGPLLILFSNGEMKAVFEAKK